MLLAGWVGLTCLCLDFAWANPAFPKYADPDEAYDEAPGPFRITRYLSLVLGSTYVVVCGASVMTFRLRLKKWRNRTTQLALLVGILLLADCLESNRWAGHHLNYSKVWNGPNWIYTPYLMCASLILTLYSVFHIPTSAPQDTLTVFDESLTEPCEICHSRYELWSRSDPNIETVGSLA